MNIITQNDGVKTVGLFPPLLVLCLAEWNKERFNEAPALSLGSPTTNTMFVTRIADSGKQSNRLLYLQTSFQLTAQAVSGPKRVN